MGYSLCDRRKRGKCLLLAVLLLGMGHLQAFDSEFTSLSEASCAICHSSADLSPLNLKTLSRDLSEPRILQTWIRIYDRVAAGEMPPTGAVRASDEVVDRALAALKSSLIEANLAARGEDRSALRRLTRLEYAYTLEDLLQIDEAIGQELAATLPAEADSGSFDTLADKQGMSAMHVRSYLSAADRAIDAALHVGPKPVTNRHEIVYTQSAYLNYMHEAKILGGGITMKLDDAVVMFFDTGSTYLMHSDAEGFRVSVPGRYKITIQAYTYQADTPVTLTVYKGVKQGVTASLDELIGSFDLIGDDPRTVEVTTFMRPGELIAPSLAEADYPPVADYTNYFAPENNVKTFKGEGIAVKTMTIEGPIVEQWPPKSTRALLKGVTFSPEGEIELSRAPYEHIVEVVEGFAQKAFRRPVSDKEVESLAELALPALADERPFIEAVRVPLRAILSSPSFLYQTGDGGKLDAYALASRLSYFLWRSMPDEELMSLARRGELASQRVLQKQVERLLSDARSHRFVKDFTGQAYRLYEIKATNPDKGLYPEYDDRLGQAMRFETELFFAELIRANSSLENLIDADFTFLNRRLADHYLVDEVQGQHMRKVDLPPQSPRGGLLGQSAIHKITANGTTTSPIPRGNFVLANLLGQPAPPPPPGVAGLEPDTRGTTTIREQLAAHRSSPICASCHKRIDPPGFAMEAFDPIGGYRQNYRVSGGHKMYGEFAVPMPFKEGREVDASGVTPDGFEFEDFEDYQRIIIEQKMDQVARHFVAQLMSFGTGAKVSFVDREQIENIVDDFAAEGYPVRSMITAVVDSDMFQRR